MPFQVEKSRANFESKVEQLEETLTRSGRLIDDQLNCVRKSGFRWILLCLLQPFYAFFGKDAFSHVRVNRVAQKIFEYCEVNQQYFYEDCELLERVKKNILQRLHKLRNGCTTVPNVIGDLDRLTPVLSKILHTPLEGMWPRDISVLGISEDQKKRLEKAYEAIKNAGNCNLEVKKNHKGSHLVIIKYENGEIKEVKVPFRITFTSNQGKLAGIILNTKKIVGEGGERKVKLCFEMQKNEYLARKKVAPLERKLMEFFQQNRSRGIPLIRSLGAKDVIEPLYAGNLSLLFGTSIFENLNQRISLIGDLLSGLKSLHSCTLTRDNQRNVKFFHFDIKPANILVRQNPKEKRWEAVLSDFGASGNPSVSGGSIGYKAPEEVKLELQLDPLNTGDIKDRNPVEEHNLKYGQPMDMWSMGLVLTILLTGRVSERINPAVFPPIPCIEDCFFNTSKPRQDHKFADLTQSQMDGDLKRLRPVFNPKLIRLWDLVGNMLQVEPEKRISAAEALTLYHEATR